MLGITGMNPGFAPPVPDIASKLQRELQPAAKSGHEEMKRLKIDIGI
jgi:hypothetical protein